MSSAKRPASSPSPPAPESYKRRKPKEALSTNKATQKAQARLENRSADQAAAEKSHANLKRRIATKLKTWQSQNPHASERETLEKRLLLTQEANDYFTLKGTHPDQVFKRTGIRVHDRSINTNDANWEPEEFDRDELARALTGCDEYMSAMQPLCAQLHELIQHAAVDRSNGRNDDILARVTQIIQAWRVRDKIEFDQYCIQSLSEQEKNTILLEMSRQAADLVTFCVGQEVQRHFKTQNQATSMSRLTTTIRRKSALQQFNTWRRQFLVPLTSLFDRVNNFHHRPTQFKQMLRYRLQDCIEEYNQITHDKKRLTMEADIAEDTEDFDDLCKQIKKLEMKERKLCKIVGPDWTSHIENLTFEDLLSREDYILISRFVFLPLQELESAFKRVFPKLSGYHERVRRKGWRLIPAPKNRPGPRFYRFYPLTRVNKVQPIRPWNSSPYHVKKILRGLLGWSSRSKNENKRWTNLPLGFDNPAAIRLATLLRDRGSIQLGRRALALLTMPLYPAEPPPSHLYTKTATRYKKNNDDLLLPIPRVCWSR